MIITCIAKSCEYNCISYDIDFILWKYQYAYSFIDYFGEYCYIGIKVLNVHKICKKSDLRMLGIHAVIIFI